MFGSLSDKLQDILGGIRGKGKLSESDVNTAMRKIRMALLEADVNYKVVKDFTDSVKERSVGSEVMESLTPGQMVVKIVNEELTELMGEKESRLNPPARRPGVILLCGLQGAGKTTHAGKIASYLKKDGKSTMLVAADVYRPAAIRQLEVVSEQVETDFFSMGDQVSPVDIAKAALKEAKAKGLDYVIIDTAGRLHIDDELMGELSAIKKVTQPDDILLVVDAMTGQDAVNVAESFNEELGITGVVLTKLDGDTRGGAALSIRKVTSRPIKFVGVGEKMEDLELFYPDRMASRILGMGDVLSLIEKAESVIDMKQAKELEEKIRSQSFDFNDYLDQMEQMKNLGPLDDILAMIPGVNNKMLKNINVDERELDRVKAMILSMTIEERTKPEIINASRKRRISEGAGVSIQELNRLLKQFKEMRKMMKNMGKFEKMMGRGGFNPFF